MNLAEANLEAQRRWGRCGCAWWEAGGVAPFFYTVGVLTPLGTRILGSGDSWEHAFDIFKPIVVDPIMRGIDFGRPTSDEQVRDQSIPSPDADPKYRIGVERVKAAMHDAETLCGSDASAEVLATVTGFILAERARA